ncbi:MAG: DUF4221 family protein [Bacteroidaceae bacterium]|nr:DUF4221 family protein [Bacteroidaceae bacterium]
MKFRTTVILIGLYAFLLTACGDSSSSRRKVKAEVPTMDFHSIKLPMEYTSEALGGFCHPTSTQIDGMDCMLMYNALIHAVEIIDLTHMKPFRQIKLKEEGRERIGDVRGVFYHQGNFILRTSFGFYRIDGEGNLLAKWAGDEYLRANHSLKGFSIMIPELTMYFNLYNFTGYDERNDRMTLSIYKQDKEDGEYPKKILVVDCKSCEVVDVVNVACPERMKHEPQLGILGSVNSLPYGDSVIYNFPASAEVFVYNRKDRTTQCYTLGSDFAEPYYQCQGAGDEGLASGYYFPLRYDVLHHCFWRVQQKPMAKGQGIAGKAFSIVRISPDFQVTDEYLIPKDKGLLPYLLFTEKQLMLNRPYDSDDGESVLCFYGVASTPVTTS